MVNRKYRDRLFCLIFGNADYKENILSLYNALCGTEHRDVDDIKLYTIDDVIYIRMKNDVSILLDSYLFLWEQQSTFNPNMPVRGLIYFAQMYSRYITENQFNIYGKKLVPLPTPRYTVLYNGAEDQPSCMKLRLSDAFIHPDDCGDFEWTATMLNLNEGKNEELLNRCGALRDYMVLVNKIRAYAKTMSFENAVDEAVVYCIEHDVMKEFLLKHRAEVTDMCITEFDEDVFVRGIKEEGREEGLEQGIEQGLKQGLAQGQLEGRLAEIFSSVEAGDYSIERGAQKTEMGVSEFTRAMIEAGYRVPEHIG